MEERYRPTLQKQLFNQPILNSIKNWLNSLQETKKNILLIYGPISCGKSISLSFLLKLYNVINIEYDNINTNSLLLPNFNQLLFNKIKQSILLIENIELISNEKTLIGFLEHVSIPVILVCNNDIIKTKYNELLMKISSNYKLIEFLKPTLSDFRNIYDNIKKDYKINISYKEMKELIELSDYDISQYFHIFELLNKSATTNISLFIEKFKQKEKDLDLNEKLIYLTDNTIPFNTIDSFYISSDPLCIFKNLYQNYLYFFNNELPFDIIDTLSISDLLQVQIFNEQCWDLYDDLSMISCVIPSYYIKKRQETNIKEFFPYKHVSYNISNSFVELKQNSVNELYNIFEMPVKSLDNDIEFNYYLKNILTQYLKILINYYDNFSYPNRGKSVKTTIDDKYYILFHIKENKEEILYTLYKFIDLIYLYKLFKFSCDEKKIIELAVLDNTVENLKNNIKYIDLSIIKRFFNISSINCNPQLFKPHIELSVKYCLLEKIFDTKNNIVKKSIYDIDDKFEDLIF